MNQTFAAIAGISADNLTDMSGPEPERLAGWRVSPRFFDVYGTRPLIGGLLHDYPRLARETDPRLRSAPLSL